MTDKVTLESLAGEIRARMDAVDANVSDAKIREIVAAELDGLVGERKLRFGGEQTAQGSKYERLGLTDADTTFLRGMLEAGHEVGLSRRGPSEELVNATRSMDTLTTTEGLELIGAQFVGQLWETARRESRVFNLLQAFDMTAPLTYLPVEVDIPTPMFVPENTSSSSSEYGTVETHSNRASLTASKFLIHQIYSGEMEEDSIIPFVPFLRAQAAKSLAHYSDALVINGDTTNAATGNINSDDADPADTNYYLAFDGIRHAALVDNTANAQNINGPLSYADLLNARGLLLDPTRIADWGHPTDPADLVYVCDPETADRIALLPEVITVDKYGSGATVLNGEVGRIGRHPLIASMAVAKSEADGKQSATPANNVLGQVVLFNRNAFKVGWRRRVQVETERLPGRDQTRLVYSFRMGFGRFTPTGAASGIEAAAVLYNITL